MRSRTAAVAIPAAIATGVVFGLVQLASMSIYGDLARRPAIPPLLPPAWGLALARPLGAPGVPAALRAAYAQALLHVGSTAAAAAIIDGLPDGAQTAELRGGLAQAEGNSDAALANYAAAGDIERAQGLIDERVAAGDLALGARYERRFVDVLTGDARATVRARALWRLGQIMQMEAVADAGRRSELERAALDSYAAALAIAPNEETYLLAAGQQALTLGDRGLAQRYYRRALEVVPASADARDGLARARS